jgi:predicted SAM-dependent methyltransferase
MNPRVTEYLSANPVAKIQLGCGGNLLDGWLNTDGQCDGWFHPNSVKLNAAESFALPDAVFDYVYSEHVIEHLTYWQGQNMLQESFRIMKPGARLRISCPDFQFLLDLYQNPSELMTDYMQQTKPDWAPYPNAIFTINNYVRDWGHKFIYDQNTLQACLQAAGFDQIEQFDIRNSNDVNLANLEADWRMNPGFLQLETMTFEAVKPQ